MTKLSLTECCLLEASGELGQAARVRLEAFLVSHPRARLQLEEAKAQMGLLGTLPAAPLSPSERRQISSQIKAGIHDKLRAQARAKRAATRWKFISYALSGLSAAAAVVIVVGIISIDHSVKEEHQQAKIAGIEQATDRLSLYRDQSTPYDQALTNVQASINQLQMDGSTQVAGADNKEMASVMDALMAQPMGDGYLETP